jgi:hypothetical protein
MSMDEGDIRTANRFEWWVIFWLAIPAVAAAGFYFGYWDRRPLADGDYSCASDTGFPAPGIFYRAHIENGKLTDMRWDGTGRHRDPYVYEIGAKEGTHKFTATIEGWHMPFSCSFSE